jgi:hypothetical protein
MQPAFQVHTYYLHYWKFVHPSDDIHELMALLVAVAAGTYPHPNPSLLYYTTTTKSPTAP